jgi:hypothetical protein
MTHLFEEMWEAQHAPLSPARYSRLQERLETARIQAPTERHARLAQALLGFLEAGRSATGKRAAAPQQRDASRRRLGRLTSERTLRVILIVGLAAAGLLSLKNPATVLLAPYLPPDAIIFLGNLRLGRQVVGVAPAFWGWLRLALELLVGGLLVAASVLIGFRRKRSGAALAYFGLLLSLTTVDILLFYFEQFSTIITTTLQFLLLLGVLVYRRHAR